MQRPAIVIICRLSVDIVCSFGVCDKTTENYNHAVSTEKSAHFSCINLLVFM